jgi:hypothetical protein
MASAIHFKKLNCYQSKFFIQFAAKRTEFHAIREDRDLSEARLPRVVLGSSVGFGPAPEVEFHGLFCYSLQK